MLVYKDTRGGTRRTPPTWLDGAADLMEVGDRHGAARWWGIGNAHLIGERTDWTDLDDGWQVAVAGPIDPRQMRRTLRWCRTCDVIDTQGRPWAVPVITDSKGNRLILAAYGKDFLPVLSAAQQRAWDIATAARDHFLAVQSVDDARLDMSLCARWMAELLSLTHHLSAEVMLALPQESLLDEALILSGLTVAVGGRLVEEPTDA